MSSDPTQNSVLELGRQIRRRREALGMTLDQLSDKSGVTPNYIGTIETGKRDPSISTLVNIASGLDTSLGELLGLAPRLSPSSMALAKLFDQVVVDVQTAVLLLLRTAVASRRK